MVTLELDDRASGSSSEVGKAIMRNNKGITSTELTLAIRPPVRASMATGCRVLHERNITAAGLLVQARGAKKKFGGITRDPYEHFKKKLARQTQSRHMKIPLMSEERKQMNISLPMNTTTLNQLISDYVPLEKFAKAPLYTKLGLQQRQKAFKENLVIIYSGAIIRRRLRKVDRFRPIELARWAQEQFVEANKAIQRRDKYGLRELATENATESLKQEFQYKTFKWELLEEIERPRIVNARVAPFNTKDNLFAQVVVRMHTKQLLAVYNSAGSLIRGHPTTPKTVIDYVVFERHLVDPESTSWRIASKLPPQKSRKERDSQQDQKLIPA